ncbi:glycosyltransferase family 4 protein [Clostridium niameyense]|uniref:Glycosyltransferase family 4 protein n=1 Tax=Clostridium niameyense TaxID=1622073 RepID=A0A6M0R737_9CLOT|nr:glycosyltransferase [Clostridium niameyense]NEZ45607.1 glycosyltransferase family 4 protein [Clostridium niameyense]
MKNEDMHILVIPSWYPTLECPLNGIFFKEQSRNLLDFNVKVGVVYPEVRWLSSLSFSKLKINHFQIREYNEDGVTTIRKHGWNLRPKFPKKRAMYWVSQAVKLSDLYIKKHGKPDVIHAHSTIWGGYAAMVLSKKYNIPYVVTEHLTEFARGLIENWQVPYIKEIFNNANKSLAVSTPFSKLLQKYSDKEIGVIHNPVDISFFEIPESREKEPFTFLCVAFLAHKKGIDVLIKSFNKAFKNKKNVKLKIGGDGDQRSNLEKLTKDLGLSDQIEFLGILSRGEVKKQMQESNVFVLPSRFETFGIVYIEALATGIPVIATKCGGPEDIVAESVGKLIEVEDIGGLSNAMIYIYENYGSYDSKELRKYCSDNFSKEAIANKLINIYKSIL